jgi:dihydrofolate reductase
MIISLIAAAGLNNEIGRDNDLPWSMPNDMKFFKETTTGHWVLMGRNTFESFGKRPLKNRTNVVVTRQNDYVAEGCTVVATIEAGIELAKQAGETELFVIGGGEIYKHAIHLADRVYLTRIYHSFDATVHFPAMDEAEWKVVFEDKRQADERHAYDYTFYTYERITV